MLYNLIYGFLFILLGVSVVFTYVGLRIIWLSATERATRKEEDTTATNSAPAPIEPMLEEIQLSINKANGREVRFSLSESGEAFFLSEQDAMILFNYILDKSRGAHLGSSLMKNKTERLYNPQYRSIRTLTDSN